MLAAGAHGESVIVGLGTGADVQSTRRVLAKLGAGFREEDDRLYVEGVGPRGWAHAGEPLDCGNSGTTIRLLAGLLAGSSNRYTLTGDASLVRRPMERVAAPLSRMGAQVDLSPEGTAPLVLRGGSLRPIDHTLDVASAQVKSAILLAALSADGVTTVREPVPTRDHTELLLSHLGLPLSAEPVIMEVEAEDPRRRSTTRRTDERVITVKGPCQWEAVEFTVPGDPSTAAFFAAAAMLVRKSDVRLPGICANPTRIGLYSLLSAMGARLQWEHRKTVGGEPVGDLVVGPARLVARKVSGRVIPRIIDELPILAVLATQADGTTVIRDAGELRHKESDRIELVAENLRRMGAKIGALEDGWAIEGPTGLQGAEINTGGDHRIAMAFAVAGLIADGETQLDDAGCVNVSCPGFFDMLDALR
jgi:3-phosphoshikimate 1-carboxyvinyltransferase